MLVCIDQQIVNPRQIFRSAVLCIFEGAVSAMYIRGNSLGLQCSSLGFYYEQVDHEAFEQVPGNIHDIILHEEHEPRFISLRNGATYFPSDASKCDRACIYIDKASTTDRKSVSGMLAINNSNT